MKATKTIFHWLIQMLCMKAMYKDRLYNFFIKILLFIRILYEKSVIPPFSLQSRMHLKVLKIFVSAMNLSA